MIVQALVNLLKDQPSIVDLAGDRGYPLELPQAPTFPAFVVWKPAGPREYDLQGDAGLEAARVQIDCYAEGYAHVVALATRITRFLSGYQGGPADSGGTCSIQGAFCINDFDMPDSTADRAGPKLRHRVLEFKVWNTEI